MEKNKNSLLGALSFFLIVATVLAVYAMFWGPLAHYSASLGAARTLSVSASGDTIAQPDIATVTFSVVSQGLSITSITDDNNKKINEAIAMLKDKAISASDIQTSQYSLEPVYTQSTRYDQPYTPSISSYRLTQSVSVKIRDFTLISPVLAALPSMGINQISGPSFGVDDPEGYLAQARSEAFDKALAKAKQIAKENGFSIGRVMNVYENSNPYPVYSKALDSSMGGLGAGEVASAPTIEPGSQKVSVSVTVSYEIR